MPLGLVRTCLVHAMHLSACPPVRPCAPCPIVSDAVRRGLYGGPFCGQDAVSWGAAEGGLGKAAPTLYANPVSRGSGPAPGRSRTTFLPRGAHRRTTGLERRTSD